MLVITSAQMAVLSADLEARTTERLYQALRDGHPEVFAALGEQRARERFQQALEQAKAWGLELWYDVAVAVDLFFRHTSLEDFDLACFGEILERGDLDGSEKAALIELAIAEGA
jgi:hypothetical protein